jgi:hypothetical protein
MEFSTYIVGIPQAGSVVLTDNNLNASPDTTQSIGLSGVVTLPPTASTPTFSPAPGRYIGSVTVTLSDTTPNAEIHYTLDGSTPLSSSPVYTGPITLTSGTQVKAIATASGYWKSADVLGQYSVIPQAPTPVISPAPGSYPAGQAINLSDSLPSATIRYTTDGSTPTTKSNWYHGPIKLTGSETIQAIAIATGEVQSAVASSVYTTQ